MRTLRNRYRPTTDIGRDLAVRASSTHARADLQIDRQAGWAWPDGASEAHYFVRGVALCKGWKWLGRVTNDHHDSPDHCKVCRDRRDDLEACGEVPR